MTQPGTARDVVIVAYDGVQLLDVAGPLEVFDAVSKVRGGGHRVRVASLGGADITCSSGLRLSAQVDLETVEGPVHTLVVAGGPGHEQAVRDDRLLGQIRRLAASAHRTTSVCTGAFVLAAAGLLRGRRVTTHWGYCAELARAHPDLTVEPDAIFVRDGTVLTSAGVTAGTDLALALVEEEYGPDTARVIGKWLVVFLRRPGGQSQFSAWTQTARIGDPLRAVLDHIAATPAADLSVPALARRAAMSERHFARRFAREVGVPPGRYVERSRVRAAQVLLESGADGFEAVARQCGFGSVETMRRAFLREIGVPPGAYRARFHTTGIPIPPAMGPADTASGPPTAVGT